MNLGSATSCEVRGLGTKEEGSTEYQQGRSVLARRLRMDPYPPRGERDRGKNASSEEGPANPSVISGMETEKGKGIVSPSNTLKDGEGSGGINKEETTNQGTRRTG